jgi:sialidase-1
MLNIRHEDKFGDAAQGGSRGVANRRAVTVSPDGATQWEKVRQDDALADPVCMASLCRSPAGLLFCNPDNPKNRDRRNLTLKLSRDDGETWSIVQRIEPGPSGYSDLAVGADGAV